MRWYLEESWCYLETCASQKSRQGRNRLEEGCVREGSRMRSVSSRMMWSWQNKGNVRAGGS